MPSLPAIGAVTICKYIVGSTSINLFVYMCGQFSTPARNMACDCFKSVFIYVIFMGTLLGGNFVSLTVREMNIWAVVAWAIVAACVYFGISRM